MELEYGKVILLGDSITQYSVDSTLGLHPQLQRYYSRRLDVLNRGYSGYNSDHLVSILPKVLATERNIRLIIIFIGTNDATIMQDEMGHIQAVPLAQYQKNLTLLVEMCTSKDIIPLLIGPALHDSSLSNNWGSTRRNHEYSQVCRQVANTKNIAFIDLWDAFRKAGGWTEAQVMEDLVLLGALLPDGIHFSDKGYAVMYDLLIPTIEKHYPQLLSSALDQMLANFRDIDPHDLNSIYKRA